MIICLGFGETGELEITTFISVFNEFMVKHIFLWDELNRTSVKEAKVKSIICLSLLDTVMMNAYIIKFQ